jgi:hypothetical protein
MSVFWAVKPCGLVDRYKHFRETLWSIFRTKYCGRCRRFSETLISKAKAVPLHAMEAFGGKGGIAPINS